MRSKILLLLAILTYISNVISEDKYLLVKLEVPQEKDDQVPALAMGDQLLTIGNPNVWSDSHLIKDSNSVKRLGKVAFRQNKVKKGGEKFNKVVQEGIKKAKYTANALKNMVIGML